LSATLPLIIANPNSGGGRGRRILRELEEALRHEGLPAQLVATMAPGEGRELALEGARRGAPAILAVGGDGTIHEVVDGLLAASLELDARFIPSLAVLPVGTGNDFFRMIRAPRDLRGAIELLRSGVPRSFEVGVADLGGVQPRAFVNLLGLGIDVEVLRRRSAFVRLPGVLQYLAALMSALRRFSPFPLRAEVVLPDGTSEAIEGDVLILALTVGPSIGGGFFLSPRARPDDGLLDLCFIQRLSFLEILRYLPAILRGAEVDHPAIVRRQVSALRLVRGDSQRMDIELDGELMDEAVPHVSVEVRLGLLRVLEPAVAVRP